MTFAVARQRASHSKSRAGCKTCRARHVKCDEMRPYCHRCTKTGRICDGYKSHSRLTERLRSIYPCPSNPVSNLSDSEGNALEFFRFTTIHQLPGASATEPPWERVALHLMHQQPCIAAAASACAALHRAVTNEGGYDQHQFSLRQYNKSLALVRKYLIALQHKITDDDVVVVLVACLLFFTYEAFSGQDAKASLHLRTGLRVIHERCYPHGRSDTNDRRVVVVTPKARSPFDTLVQIFLRLDLDYTVTGHDDPYLYPICEGPMTSIFSSPDEASLYFQAITANIIDFYGILCEHTHQVLKTQRDMDTLSIYKQKCLVRAALRTVNLDRTLTKSLEDTRSTLRAWMGAFAVTPQTNQNLLSHISTQIMFFCVWLWTETWRDVDSVVIDRFESQFEYFTNLCGTYLDLYIAKTPLQGRFATRNGSDRRGFDTPPAFSLGSGVVTCLAVIVERCRTYSIRQRCITMLRKINLEGVFDTGYLVAYLLTIMEHEEQAARQYNPHFDHGYELRAHDIPEAARLLEVIMSAPDHFSKFDFYKTKQVGMVYVINTYGSMSNELQIGEVVVNIA